MALPSVLCKAPSYTAVLEWLCSPPFFPPMCLYFWCHVTKAWGVWFILFCKQALWRACSESYKFSKPWNTSLVWKTLHSDDWLILWLLISGTYCTVSSLKEVQLQLQEKTAFRLDLENAMRYKDYKAFGPLLWGNTLMLDLLTSE